MKLTWKTEYELEELESRLRETLNGKVPNPEDIQIFTDEFRNAIQGEEAIDTNTNTPIWMAKFDANHIYAAQVMLDLLTGKIIHEEYITTNGVHLLRNSPRLRMDFSGFRILPETDQVCFERRLYNIEYNDHIVTITLKRPSLPNGNELEIGNWANGLIDDAFVSKTRGTIHTRAAFCLNRDTPPFKFNEMAWEFATDKIMNYSQWVYLQILYLFNYDSVPKTDERNTSSSLSIFGLCDLCSSIPTYAPNISMSNMSMSDHGEMVKFGYRIRNVVSYVVWMEHVEIPPVGEALAGYFDIDHLIVNPHLGFLPTRRSGVSKESILLNEEIRWKYNTDLFVGYRGMFGLISKDLAEEVRVRRMTWD